jgi:hypothetical protein
MVWGFELELNYAIMLQTGVLWIGIVLYFMNGYMRDFFVCIIIAKSEHNNDDS